MSARKKIKNVALCRSTFHNDSLYRQVPVHLNKFHGRLWLNRAPARTGSTRFFKLLSDKTWISTSHLYKHATLSVPYMSLAVSQYIACAEYICKHCQ